MTMKSLLLGAAAGLVTVGAAQAADLPMTKAEAVEYVKVCTEFGAGFFYIPGSDTCLKIGGDIRANYHSGYPTISNPTRANDALVFDGRGQIAFDARTATEYGTLRSFFAIDGNFGNGSSGGITGSGFQVDKAYIQLGGLTAGYAHSFFGFYDNDYGNDIFQPYYAFPQTRALIAYTAAFGGGFTATLSAEDGKSSRNVMWDDNAIIQATALTSVYGGLTAPDGVARLRLDQSWGQAAISAAVHQVRLPGFLTITGTGGASAGGSQYDTKYGFAVAGSLGVNLPIAAGGHFAVEGTYAKGATSYLGVASSDVSFTRTNAKLASGWAVTGEFGVNVTPAFTVNLLAGYVNYKGADALGNGLTTTGDDSYTRYTVGGNVWYVLTKGFKVGAEVYYDNTNYKHVAADSDGWGGGVSIRREF